jgi:hypothetical protein
MTFGAGVRLWIFSLATCDLHLTEYNGACRVIACILMTIVFKFHGKVNCLCLSRGQNWWIKAPACCFSSSIGVNSWRLIFHAVQVLLWFDIT